MQNTPKYLSIMQDIKRQIENGSLKSGDKLKSEQEYSLIYDASAITIRKALEILVNEKLIYRIKGKGSFVSKPAVQVDNSRLMVVVFSMEDCFDVSFMQIIMGLQRTLAQMNYSLIVEWNNRNLEEERISICNMIRKQVDGVFLYPYDPDASIDNYRLLDQAHIPYILLDHRSEQFLTHYVSCDNRMGGAIATSYMLSMNHRNLRFITYDFIMSSEQERYEAFHNLMVKRGLCKDGETQMMAFDEINFADLASEIRQGSVTGLICANDRLALRCINHLISQGIRIPEDVSIIGFDDWERNSTSPVPLTTIQQSFVNLGVCAAQMMRIIRESPMQEKCSMQTSVRLICRQSVRALEPEC